MKQLAFVSICMALAISGCSVDQGSSSKAPSTIRSSMTFDDDMNQYSRDLVARANESISTPSSPKKTTDMPSYVVSYVIEKDEIKTSKDGATNDVSFAVNTAITNMWSNLFCTNDLKSIMAKHDVFMVSGHLIGKDGVRHSMSSCMN